MRCLKYSYFLLSFFVLFIWQHKSFAQSGNYSVKKYTIKDGLPHLITHNIYQDRRGFLWIGTASGLCRFDGKNFVIYGMRQGLNDKSINVMTEDKQGRLWVCTKGTIFRFLNHRFIEYPLSDSATFDLYKLVELKSGDLWILTTVGAYHLEKDHWEKRPLLAGFENKLCMEMIETDKGNYYNYKTSIIFKDNNGNISHLWDHEEANRGMYFSHIKLFNDTLYIATYDGIYQVAGNNIFKKLFENRLNEKCWRLFFIDSKRRFWVSEIDHAGVLISEPGKYNHFSDSISLTITSAPVCFEDKDQNIWMVSAEGLLKVQEQNTSEFSIARNSLISEIRNITETPDKNILAFSRENGILQFNNPNFVKATIQFYQNNIKGRNDFLDSYTTDDKNRQWWATRNDRLFCLDKGKLIDYSNPAIPWRNYLGWISFNPITKKLFISQDTLKTITDNEIKIFQPANKKDPAFLTTFIHCFKNGKTIFASISTGIRLIDENDSIFDINQQLGFGKSIIPVRFYETPSGDFWMYGTIDGIKHFRWNKNGFPENDLQISTVDGLPNDVIMDMCMDKQNRLWVSTMAGPAIIELDTSTKRIEVSTLTDHMNLSTEYPATNLFCASDGYIWLASYNCIYRFDPRKISFHSSTPEIGIEDIQLNQKTTNWENYTDSFYGYWQMPVKPVMKYDENTLQINFTGISFTSSAEFLYSYRLDGLDTSWSNPSTSNFVLFAKLLPGKYTFSVKCKTRNSNWSEAAIFSFTLRHPFWETWWFRLLIIAMAASLIIVFFRNRIKKIEQKAFINHQLVELEMTALKAQMNPHFIYNALNSIQALVMEGRKDESVYYIGTFSRLLRQVLENSERNVITLQKELQTLEHYISLDALRLNMQPTYRLHIDKDIQTDSEKIPPLILQPFVENALWHGLSKREGDKKLDITISVDNDWLVCTIQDNGIGRVNAAALKTANSVQYQSKAIAITTKRLTDFNEDKNRTPIIFEDLIDEDGTAAGTKCILYIKRKS